jgi:excisionase family DNA binding protein
VNGRRCLDAAFPPLVLSGIMPNNNQVVKQEFWTKQIAAKYLGLSVRQLMEISLNGKLKRSKQFDPGTRREAAMFLRSDVEALKRAWTPAADSQLAIVRPAAPAPEAAAPPAAPQHWITLAEAADVCGLPAAVLLRLVREERLPAIDCGPRPGGRYRVRRDALGAIGGDAINQAL